MSRRISPDDLILPRTAIDDEEKGIVNGTFSSRFQAAATENLDEEFYESVSLRSFEGADLVFKLIKQGISLI